MGMLTSDGSWATYNPTQSYQSNYDHAPVMPPVVEVPASPGRWTFCGRPIPSPLGIPAGPLLNGRWILHYAALGFDVLTYKTVRSRARECYPEPNLQPVTIDRLDGPATDLATQPAMTGNWAVSFGMPSQPPAVWRADIEWTRSQLPSEKLLCVSVVATPESQWTLSDLAADFAQCARWAVEAGADAVEANLSCPNVSTRDGQLYQHPEAARVIAQSLRDAVGAVPLILKIGHVAAESDIETIVTTIGPIVDAFSMTNCIAATVRQPDGTALFGGQPRGIAGDAIRAASVAQVRRFADVLRRHGLPTKLIGVGGIFIAAHVAEYLAAGAESVQLATAAMLDPGVGTKIRRELSSSRL
jgi:dihydroorotate dehydrogenase (NAD+) catalytic subunit